MYELSQYLMKGLSNKTQWEKTLDSPFNCFNFRSGSSKQSFTNSGNQSTKYRMSGTTVTRQRTRSNSNVEMIDHSALNAIEKENQAANSDRGKTVEQTTIQLGKTAWDDVFEEGNL